MKARGLIVAAPRSGAGKTMVTLATLGGAAAARHCGARRQGRAGLHRPRLPCRRDRRTRRQSRQLGDAAGAPRRADGGRRARRRTLVIEGVMGLFDGVASAPGRCGTAADLAARFSSRCCWCSMSPDNPNRPRPCCGALPAHDPAVRIAGVVSTASAASGIGPSATPSRTSTSRCSARCRATRRWRCRSAISAWCRRASMAISRHGSTVSPRWRSAISISTPRLIQQRRSSRRRLRTAPPLPPPGQRIALASDAAFSFVYPHCRRLAPRRCADRLLLSLGSRPT